MARNYGTLLIAVALLGLLACRREPPPPPPPGASAAPADVAAPVSVVTTEPDAAAAATAPTADQAPGGGTAAGAPATGAHAGGARSRRSSTGGAGHDESGKRKSAVREAAEQQRPMAKQPRGGGRLHAPKGNEPSSPKIVAAREVVATVAASPATTARATLLFKNAAGATYKMVEARFVLDGAELPMVLQSAARGQTQAVFSGEITPGRHVIAAHLTYQGADRAVFTYMKGYTFRVQSDDTFVARENESVTMTVVCKEKTGFNIPVEKRLFVTIEAEGPP